MVRRMGRNHEGFDRGGKCIRRLGKDRMCVWLLVDSYNSWQFPSIFVELALGHMPTFDLRCLLCAGHRGRNWSCVWCLTLRCFRGLN